MIYSKIIIRGNPSGQSNTETFKFRAYDGTDWSSWASVNVGNMENVKPTLSLNTVEIKVNDKKKLFTDFLSTYKYLNDQKNGHESITIP